MRKWFDSVKYRWLSISGIWNWFNPIFSEQTSLSPIGAFEVRIWVLLLTYYRQKSENENHQAEK
jgi:hypothetical protein